MADLKQAFLSTEEIKKLLKNLERQPDVVKENVEIGISLFDADSASPWSVEVTLELEKHSSCEDLKFKPCWVLGQMVEGYPLERE